MKIKRFAAVLMILCLMAGSALAAQFTVEMNGENGVITAVIPDSGRDTLVIPDKAKNEIGEDVVPGQRLILVKKSEELDV